MWCCGTYRLGGVCPCCGYCPACGRSDWPYRPRPIMPWRPPPVLPHRPVICGPQIGAAVMAGRQAIGAVG